MPSITDLVRSLGNDGARTNARLAIEARRREEWAVTALVLRLAEAEPQVSAASRHDATAGAA